MSASRAMSGSAAVPTSAPSVDRQSASLALQLRVLDEDHGQPHIVVRGLFDLDVGLGATILDTPTGVVEPT
jgi:hypothetical protein